MSIDKIKRPDHLDLSLLTTYLMLL